ncbi:hypothetical protein VTK73DRAFT_4941 [Phialemonium thermophilum]|uniref:Uncharacterized protein n=1 Tax=Phialemonium thermophilum TaxID=223376 RepID=A0ABR3V4N4_9PEZI
MLYLFPLWQFLHSDKGLAGHTVVWPRGGSTQINLVALVLCLALMWRRSSCSPRKPVGLSLQYGHLTLGCLGRSSR